MKIPTIRGVIDRRMLVNYRVDPDVLARALPAPFRPKLAGGHGMSGICLIRLKHIRPTFAPTWLGLSSENAAHRVAVEWDEQGATREGVYIFRRDTSSRLNALAGGRLFPGLQYHARFVVAETDGRYSIALRSDDAVTRVAVSGTKSDQWNDRSVFRSLPEASAFFEAGAVGFSPTSARSRFQGMELRCDRWQVESLAMEELESSFFANEAMFPAGSVEFDCALLMRDIDHQWHSTGELCCGEKR